jgi:hypothetical protein
VTFFENHRFEGNRRSPMKGFNDCEEIKKERKEEEGGEGEE